MVNILNDYSCSKYSSRNGEKPEWIVISCPTSLGTAKTLAKYFTYSSSKLTSHYVVGDKQIYQLVPVKCAAWHFRTDYVVNPLCTNQNSIGIEFSIDKCNTCVYSSYDTDWFIKSEIYDNLVDLTVNLCQEYAIPISHVVRVYDINHKRNPLIFSSDVVYVKYGKSGNQIWREFIATVSERLNNDTNSK